MRCTTFTLSTASSHSAATASTVPTAQLFDGALPMLTLPQRLQIGLRRNQTNSGKFAGIFDLPGAERNSDFDYRNRDYRQPP
jgi:hypothetical protein